MISANNHGNPMLASDLPFMMRVSKIVLPKCGKLQSSNYLRHLNSKLRHDKQTTTYFHTNLAEVIYYGIFSVHVSWVDRHFD